MKRTHLTAACVAALTAAAVPAAAHAMPGYGERPMDLPSTSAVRAAQQPGDWIVGARPGAAATAAAKRHGATPLAQSGGFRVPARRARAFAASLRERGVLSYAEPDGRMHRASTFDAAPGYYGRAAVVGPGLTPPSPGNVKIAVVDDLVDLSHPDLGPQTQHLNSLPGGVLGSHGTQVASAASGAANGSGVLGIFPSVPILSYGIPLEISCTDAANGVTASARARARIINLSFGSPAPCFTLFRALQAAYTSGSLVIASAGNEFAAGNPVIYPAAYPHVLSVGAIDQNLGSAGFSSESLAIDVAAPGVAIPAATPLAFDNDGNRDGLSIVDGTSFSAPIVSGTAAWLSAVRPRLSNGQIAEILRRSAQDIGPSGYDTATGFGLVRLAQALAHPTPRTDPREPNDDIPFVDGTAGKRASFLYSGRGRKTLSGTVDAVEDPVDVYRVKLRPRSRIRVRLRPSAGNADLTVFNRNARTVADNRRIVTRSRRSGRATDAVSIRNTSRSARSYFVAVDAGRGQVLNAAYRLQLVRQKFR